MTNGGSGRGGRGQSASILSDSNVHEYSKRCGDKQGLRQSGGHKSEIHLEVQLGMRRP